MAYVVLDPRTGRATVANAGHDPLLVHRESLGRVMALAASGPARGLVPGPDFDRSLREEPLDIAPGDRLLLNTDGVVECRDPIEAEYGRDRLAGLLATYASSPSDALVDALLDDLERHRGPRQADGDVTVLSLRPTGTGSIPGE